MNLGVESSTYSLEVLLVACMWARRPHSTTRRLSAVLGRENGSKVGKALDRVLAEVNRPVLVEGGIASVSASIGYTLYPEDASDADLLLRHADQAMYLAKDAGKNQYRCFAL